MLSPSTMVASTLENTVPGKQKKQNQFIKVILQTYHIQITLAYEEDGGYQSLKKVREKVGRTKKKSNFTRTKKLR